MDQDEFNLKLSRLYSGEDSDSDECADSNAPLIDRIADDAPVINLLNSIFLEALTKKASDIHIESGPVNSAVKYRVDGILLPARNISAERASAVSTRLKILSGLNVLEKRRPQDGHIDIKTGVCSPDVRISIVPAVWGESIVLRLLNRSDVSLSLDALGFSARHYDSIKKLLTLSSGLVLVTGPTGSGKTTTLAAILGELNNGNTKIISIEDPVEYRIPGITQIQVHDELGLNFENLLRRIFRQDPDIIMIGEIRDIETAELAVRAALTGHLVFATLHTSSAAEAVYRLQNMGIPGYMAGVVLKSVIAQRLIRKTCRACSGSGCAGCSQTGFAGRTVIAEILSIDTELQDRIAANQTAGQIGTYLRDCGYRTIFDDAVEKLKGNVTTSEEIRRELGFCL